VPHGGVRGRADEERDEQGVEGEHGQDGKQKAAHVADGNEAVRVYTQVAERVREDDAEYRHGDVDGQPGDCQEPEFLPVDAEGQGYELESGELAGFYVKTLIIQSEHLENRKGFDREKREKHENTYTEHCQEPVFTEQKARIIGEGAVRIMLILFKLNFSNWKTKR